MQLYFQKFYSQGKFFKSVMTTQGYNYQKFPWDIQLVLHDF